MLYIQHYIKTVHFWLKYNGPAIVRKTTKLTEGGHRGLQDYRHICYFFYVFLTFLTFFSKSKSRDFYVFCRVSYVFSNYAWWPYGIWQKERKVENGTVPTGKAHSSLLIRSEWQTLQKPNWSSYFRWCIKHFDDANYQVVCTPLLECTQIFPRFCRRMLCIIQTNSCAVERSAICLSSSSIMAKRLNVSSKFVHQLLASSF